MRRKLKNFRSIENFFQIVKLFKKFFENLIHRQFRQCIKFKASCFDLRASHQFLDDDKNILKKNIKYSNNDEFDYSDEKRQRQTLKQYLNKLSTDEILRVLSIGDLFDSNLKQIQFDKFERDSNEIRTNLIR